ncbi:T9SS type A sorting domain-containing protein [Chryseobacterium nepalense]|uniref:T9SS type A sorting domain-containing protein n=1 Tax=Chryseobacterium nepalense TaxID=1854498 RepID=UPI002DF8E2B0|nr:hypothetical protein [Chryseobacterium nepalense]
MFKKLFLLLTLATAFTAKSQITLVNPQPDFSFTAQATPPQTSASGTNLFPINLDNDAYIEYAFRWDVYNNNEWYIHFPSFSDSSAQMYVIANGLYVTPLNFGAAINASTTYSLSADPFIGNYFTPNFQNQGNRYIGFKASISGTVYYGWVLVELVNRTLTVKEYAFTTNASGITAGQGGTLSVTETTRLNDRSVTFGPNPAGSFITIDNSSHTGSAIKITVHDLSGKLIMKQEAQFGKPVDVSSLQRGTYMLRIEHEGITAVRKMIKK